MKYQIYTYFILFLITVIAASASWTQYQSSDLYHHGLQNTNEFGTFTSLGNQVTDTTGGLFQPVIDDVNGDGVTNLMFISGGNTITTGYFDGQTFTTIINKGVGGSVSSQPYYVDDFNSNGFNEYVVIVNQSILAVYEFNGTATNLLQNATTPNGLMITAPGCLSDKTACYLGNDQGEVIEYNLNTNGISRYNVSSTGVNAFNTLFDNRTPPIIKDVDLDGSTELIFLFDANANGDEGFMVWDVTSANLDTYFSSDGIIDNIGGCGSI